MSLEIKQNIHGSVSLVSGAKTLNIVSDLGFSAVTMNKCLLICYCPNDASSPNNYLLEYELTSTTAFRMAINGTQTPTVYYHLIEFTAASNITITRGSQSVSSTATATTISISSMANAFPIVCYKNTGTSLSYDDFVSANITSISNMNLGIGSGTFTVYWQVIESTDFTVTKFSNAWGASDYNLNHSISVSVTKAFVYITGHGTAASNINCDDMPKAAITSTTNLNLWRYLQTSAQPWQTYTYLVQITGNSTVQASGITLGTGSGEGEDYETVTVSAGSSSDSFPIMGCLQSMSIANNSGDENGEMALCPYWYSSSQVRVIRGNSNSQAQGFLQILRIIPATPSAGGHPYFYNRRRMA